MFLLMDPDFQLKISLIIANMHHRSATQPGHLCLLIFVKLFQMRTKMDDRGFPAVLS